MRCAIRSPTSERTIDTERISIPTASATLSAYAGQTSHRRRFWPRFAAPLQPKRAGRGQRRVQPGEVVGTASGGHEHHVEHHEGDADESVVPHFVVAKQSPQAVQHQRGSRDAREHDHLHRDAGTPAVQRLGLARNHRRHP